MQIVTHFSQKIAKEEDNLRKQKQLVMAINDDENNYKGISDLFIETMICFYSYNDPFLYKKKFKNIIQCFSNMYSDLMKNIINYEFSDIKLVFQTLQSIFKKIF